MDLVGFLQCFLSVTAMIDVFVSFVVAWKCHPGAAVLHHSVRCSWLVRNNILLPCSITCDMLASVFPGVTRDSLKIPVCVHTLRNACFLILF